MKINCLILNLTWLVVMLAMNVQAQQRATTPGPVVVQQNSTQSGSAAVKRPDFTGTWQLAAERTKAEAGSDQPSEEILRIAHSGDILGILANSTRPKRGRSINDLSLVTDGVERHHEREWWVTTEWEGTSITSSFRTVPTTLAKDTYTAGGVMRTTTVYGSNTTKTTYTLEAGGSILHVVYIEKYYPSKDRRSDYFYNKVSDIGVQSESQAGGVNITGDWSFASEISEGSGNISFTFKQEGETLTGMYKLDEAEGPLTGTVKGADIKFTFKVLDKVTRMQNDLTITCVGKIDGTDSMKGSASIDLPGKVIWWTAKRKH